MAPAAMFTTGKSPTGSVPTIASSEENGSSADLWTRGTLIMQRNNEANTFVQELCMRHQFLSEEFAREIQKYDIERREWANWKQNKKHYEESVNAFRASLERDPFVLVLIDGDGMIFRDEYFKAGEVGGREAANKLCTAISDHITRESTLPFDCEVVCLVYANVRGLAEVLVRTGVVEDITVVENFTKGFTRGKTSFDFIDVGPGKDRADEKLIRKLERPLAFRANLYSGVFKRNVGVYQCRRIYFGCSHDNGYARVLEDHATDTAYQEKVFLMEGVPFEKELLQLPFRTKKFPEIFRGTKISLWGAPGTVNPTAAPFTPPISKVYPIISGLPGRFPPPPRQSSQNSDAGSPVLLPRTPSASTLASNDSSTIITSWAAKAAAAPPTPGESPVYKPAHREEIIARNRAGQRVDPPTRDYDKAEVDRIKKLKMCNVHFLRRECPYGINCTHIHDYSPSNRDIATLRLVARMAPCQHGSSCQDIKCIYGHRCPAPLAKIPPPKGEKPCIFSEACKFPLELHNIDCNVVKTLVIR
ncbi:hypothetical protein BDV96DRAFT_148635 [Lophiotrema nucula]|uniref:C3H1-type domain-containing protein n=1 Tax=Lophiotrema nucula TaxID=690887 RepID=A0A6A5Z2A9_9PLEO|nr:hypothetical protein BDV96DRAFT_148635 [Lophiotrema nucula]